MHKFLLCFALALPAAAQTGFTIVHGEHTGGDAHLISSATIIFTPVTAAGLPMSFQAGGNGGPVLNLPVSAQLQNGAFSVVLADTSLSSPRNPCYKVQIIDNASKTQLIASGYTCIQPTGATWSLDTYSARLPSTPLVATSLAGAGVSQISVVAQSGLTATVVNPTTSPSITVSVDPTHYLPTTTDSGIWNLYTSPFLPSGTGHRAGTVPDPGATSGSTRFLREDGTWSALTTGAVTPSAVAAALNATTDSSGAAKFLAGLTGKQIAGSPIVSQYATKTTGGDGIYGTNGGDGLSKAVATCVAGCNITIDSAYAGQEVEPQFVPSGQYGWASAYPDGMQLHDYRNGKELHVHNNVTGVASGVFSRFDHNPTGSTARNEGFRVDSIVTAPGQSSYGAESDYVGIHSNNIFSSLGIKAGLQVDVVGNSPGDTQGSITRVGCSGGAQNPDDQFCQAAYTEMQDSPSNTASVPRINVTALSGASTDGSMAISGAVYPGTYDRNWGQGRFALKVKENGTDAALYNLHLTGTTSPSGSPYSVTDGPFGHGSFGTLSASDIPASLPVSSAIGQSTSVIHVPATNGVATPVTATFALVSGTYHTGIACELGQFRGEQVNITAVQSAANGKQAITFGLRLDPDGGTNRGQFYPFIFQDPAGSTNGLCGTVSKSGAYNMGDGLVSQAVPLVGAMLDSTGKKVLIYGAHYNAGIASFPAPIFGVQNVTLIRQSGIAYITGGLTDQTSTTNVSGAVIVASDTSFSTTSSPKLLPYTSGPGQIGYANAGPDTTTPVTATLQIFSAANVASIYNAAEVINTTNAGTIGKPGFVGSTLSLEPFAWSIDTGTTLESPPHYSGGISLSAEVMTANLPGNNTGKTIAIKGTGSSGTPALTILNQTPLAQMRGHGGFVAPQSAFTTAGSTGTFSSYVNASNPETGSTIIPVGAFGGNGITSQSYGSLFHFGGLTDLFSFDVNQWLDTYNLGYRYGEMLTVTRTIKDGNGLVTRQGGFNFNSIVTGRNAVNDLDLPTLAQTKGLIAAAVPNVTLATIQAANNTDTRITAIPFSAGTDGNPAPIPALGTELLTLNAGVIVRERSDASMSALCDDSGVGSAKCPTVAQIQAVQTNVATEVTNRQTAIVAVAATIPVIPVSSNGLASDTKGVPYAQNYLNLQAENNADPRITYIECSAGTDGNPSPSPAPGNEGITCVGGHLVRKRSDGSTSQLTDSSGQGAPAGIPTFGTPASSSAACTVPQVMYDASFTYYCVAANTWKESPLNAF